MSSISIHEDDEGLCNLYPAAFAEETVQRMDDAIAAYEKNRNPDSGYVDSMHMIEHPETPYLSLQLKADDCAKALEASLPRIRTFTMGGTSNNPFYRHETDAYCFGFDEELYVKLETEGGLVSYIWYDVWTREA